MAKVRIRAGHVRPLWAGHPWVYAQAVAGVEGTAAAGDLVDVLDAQGNWLGAGFFSPGSSIAVRILSRTPGESIDAGFFRDRFSRAQHFRGQALGLPDAETTGYRLVHSEGDGLSGLIVDRYADAAVIQFLSAGMKRRQAEVLAALREVTGVRSIVELPAAEHQEREGFTVEAKVVAGDAIEALEFRERGFDYRLELGAAQKTGFYFDQRENRARFEAMARGRRVLDACCYVGAFSLAAARGGASQVTALDRSEPALAVAQDVARRNRLDERIRFERADIKRALPELLGKADRYDLIVLDPPKLAHSIKHLDNARKAYRAWNALAFQLCERGAVIVTCSCSAAMQTQDFLRTLALAAADAQRGLTVFAIGQQSADHPTPAAFDEGRYLKAAFARVE
ncbi:MAG TPA: class I SAM-dependent rRNA methyltransferase [Polyangiales bacterium]|nr:class I SAM-dependent rRNA methyltransferase [Polyangiales bacterium]